ncbi:uncharacterized protein LOC113236169 [Hyposmocoma kahamanoa]|uniref:uncharacterized protein LOC113236169 n=1 Tax=Hyposmocoma kahamanoa TaxID=1477025 RepID=UPI000E6D9330|nr:uncharacterized protein LOC113236169 [Hyposmocoma kahamanoa]
MAAYAQQGTKRQKVREPRSENVDYFQGVERVEYNNMAALVDTSSYRYYNNNERVHSRAMEDWLKCSVSLTDFRGNGSDLHGRSTLNRSWDDTTNSLDNHKRCVKALFDLMSKLGVKYWTAFDTDLVPAGDSSWEEIRLHWDDMVEYIQELNQRYHVKMLWLAPDLHSHPRYASGAITSSDATSFIQAATQVKKCLEISQRLNAECFLLWPYREGYDSIFQTDVQREIKLFSKLLKMTADYRDRLNYKCQLLIMPYYNCNTINHGSWNFVGWMEREMVNMYMWDVTSCLYFLKNYNLERYYKVCCPPGHHMFMANVYNMLGGVTIWNNFDHCDSRTLTLMIKNFIDQGTIPPAGINLKLTPRRDSDLREMVTVYVKYIDAAAKALRIACTVIAEQVFHKHLQQRYATYYSGFGSRLISGEVSLEECEEYYKKNQSTHTEYKCNKSEHLDIVFQRYIDTCDRI